MPAPRATPFVRHDTGLVRAALLLSVIAVAASPATTSGDEPAAAPQPANLAFTIADVMLGEAISGPELTADSLKHRVVLLAFWNREEPASTNAMPLLEQTSRTLANRGVLVIGSHGGAGASVEVKPTVEKLGLTFPVLDDCAVKGLDLQPMPHVLLFDHTGKCVARGSPLEMAARTNEAARDAPPLVLAGRHLEKQMGLERMLWDESKFGAVLRKAGELTEGEDEAAAEEARYVIERLNAHGESLLAEAEKAKATDAVVAAGLLQRVVTAFRGGDLGKRAMELQREWKQDKAFTDGLQAASLAAQLETLRAQVLAPPAGRYGRGPRPGGTASMAAAQRIPPAVKAQMAQIAGMVRQLCPDSRYAARAEEIAIELQLQLPAAP